jgi:hypothetical protein
MRFRPGPSLVLLALIGGGPSLFAAAKPHSVLLGAVKIVPYSVTGDPSNAQPDETHLRVRPLLVDGKLKEWTTGESHDITDRSFVVRRALRINDALPGDKIEHWIWQRGPWLLVDRAKAGITALRLPDYEPTVSNVIWFRDYAAYCGLTTSGRELYAVVAQVAARKPILVQKLSAWSPEPKPGKQQDEKQAPACASATWQREPLRVTFEQTGSAPVSYDLVGLSSVLVEDGNGEDNPSAPSN